MSNGSDILFFAFMLINVSLILVKTVPSARTTAATEDTNALARLPTQAVVLFKIQMSYVLTCVPWLYV